MTNNLKSLLKIEFISRIGFNSITNEKNSKKKNRKIAMGFLYIFPESVKLTD